MILNYIAGAGKDSVADVFCEKYGYKKFALSDGIYAVCRGYFGMTDKDRELIITVGEKLREIDVNVWIKYTLAVIEKYGGNKIIISDVRRNREMEYLEAHGYVGVMVYCDIDVAIQRLKARDKSVNEDTVIMNQIENELRPLAFTDGIITIDNSKNDNLEHAKKQVDGVIGILEERY